MLQVFKRAVVALALVLGLLGTFNLVASGTVSAADPTDAAKNSVCKGIAGDVGGTCGDGGTNITKTVKTVVNVMSIIAGVATVIMVIVAGFKYITSGGDASAVGSAKKTLVYALVGTIVVILSQFIVKYVISNV